MDYQMFILMMVFAHFIGDYVFQSAWLSEQKKTHRWPMIVHCILYTGCIGYAISGWTNCSWEILVCIFSSHVIIDKFRTWFEAKRWWVSRENDWLATFIDQFLHLLVLLMIIIKYR